jgi:hypothetical protein
LVSLVTELNHHTELTVKLSSTNKIAKILGELAPSKDVFAEIQQQKTNPQLNFRSKIKLELKAHSIDPRVRQILSECREKLETL